MKGKIYQISCPEMLGKCYVGSTHGTLKKRWDIHKALYVEWLNGQGGTYAIFPFFKKYGLEKFTIQLIKEYDCVDKNHIRVYEQLWINKTGSKAVNKKSACQVLPSKVMQRIRDKKDPEKARARWRAKYKRAKERTGFMQKVRERAKKRYENNIEKVKEYRKKYRITHKESIKEKAKDYRTKNKDKLREYTRKWYKSMCAEMKVKYRERAKKWYALNKDRIKELQTRYYLENKEACKSRQIGYYQMHKETHKANVQKYYQTNRETLLARAKAKVQCECGSEYQRAGKTNHLRTKKHRQWEEKSSKME